MDEAQKLRILEAMDHLEAIQQPAAPTAAEYNRGMPGRPPAAPDSGVLGNMLTGAGEAIGRRLEPYLPSFPQMTAAPGMAGSIGKGLPAAAVGATLPATGLAGMAAQGLLSGGYEALDPASTKGSILGATALGAATTGAFDLAGRAVSGMGRRVVSAIQERSGQLRQAMIRTQSDSLRTLAETLGGMGGLNRQQQRLVNTAAVESIGEVGQAVSPAIRRQAAERIGQGMDAALPTGPVDVTAAFTLVDDIPAAVLPGKSRLLELIQRAETSPQAYQDAARGLREAGRAVARSPNAAFATEVHAGLEALTTAGEAAGAVSTRELREQYKNLVLLESIPALRRTGQVPAMSVESALFRSYGNSTTRQAGAGTLPATRRFIEISQAAAEEVASRFKSSGTGERMVQAGAAQDAMGLLTGSTSPSALARTLGTVGLVGPLAGAAAVGTRSEAVGQAGAIAGRALAEKEKDRARQ